MIRKAIALALSGAMLMTATVTAAAQEEPRVFTRSGQWQLDAAEDECRIARVFVNGDQQIALAMERNRAEAMVRLVLVGDGLDMYRSTTQLGYRFMPAADQRTARLLLSETPDGQTYLNMGHVFMAPPLPPAPPVPGEGPPLYDRAAEQEFAAGITAIEINEGLMHPLRLETGSLRAAITALQACQDDLLRVWGLDWEKHQTMTRRAMPEGAPHEWVPHGVIMRNELILFAGGRNPFRVMVDAEGRATSCSVHWPSLPEETNAEICAGLVERGRFLPALDAQGQPMASYWMVDFAPGLMPPPRQR